ncbi:alpha/beta hydrolase [Brachybacterium paraconglomeratum]
MGCHPTASDQCSRCSIRSDALKGSKAVVTSRTEIRERRSSMSLLSRLMPTIMRLRRSNKDHLTRDHVRRYLDRTTRHPQPSAPPSRLAKGVTLTSRGVRGWDVHTVSPTEAPSQGTVIYLHGGGWMNEAAPQHWSLVQQVAREASVDVVLPVYPLVQSGGNAETVTPIVAELARDAARPLVLMGDSAGGTIAISTTLLLKEQGTPADLTVLISPALDMRMENPEIDEVQPFDPWLVKNGQLLLTEMWIGEHREDPILNPFLGDPRGAGELIIFSGTRDLLNPDTRLFVDAARAAGANVTYYEQAGSLHVYPILPTREGREARRAIVDAIRRVVTVH